MRAFVIDKHLEKAIKNMVKYAEEHPVTIDDILDQLNGQRKPVGEIIGHVVYVPSGYKIVYSIEQQTKGTVRHLSMSVDKKGRTPNPLVVRSVMEMVGFKNGFEKCKVWLEEFEPEHQAVNVVEKM